MIRNAIGRVIAGRTAYVLYGVDDWEVAVGGKPDRELAESVASLYRGRFRGPQSGHYGWMVLEDLAANTGGVLKMSESRPDPTGRIY